MSFSFNQIVEVITKIFSNKYYKNILILAGGSSIGQVILLVVSPILTRLYTVDDFGLLAVYSSIIGILGIIVALKFDLALMIPDNDKDAVILLFLAISGVLLVSTIFGLVTWIFRIQIEQLLKIPNFSNYIWLIPIGLIGSGIYLTLNYWAIRKKSYTIISRTKIAQGLSAASSQVGFGLVSTGPLGLIIGSIFGSSAGVWSLSKLIKKENLDINKISVSNIVKVAKRYKDFPLISVPGALLNNSGVHVPVFFLTIIFDPVVTGLYSLADRVIRSPLSIIGKATQEAYLGEFSDILRLKPSSLLNLFKDTSRQLFYISIAPILGAFIFGPIAFKYIFGENWQIAGEYVRILSPMLLFRFITSPLIHTLNLLEKQRILMIWEGLRLISIIGIFYFCYLFALSATLTMILYSIVGSISYIAIYLLILFLLKKK
ncbi:MAG: oligosaccharide flippase family protein [Ignavibacteriales bacterium]|nr:oligosaccharide flippase family protein [Ignavibacteriales bacterium]